MLANTSTQTQQPLGTRNPVPEPRLDPATWSMRDLADMLVGTPELTHRENLAYTAGFIDGDGCFHIARQKYPHPPRNARPCYRGRVVISQNDRFVLEHVREVLNLGGRIYRGRVTAQNNKAPHNLVYDSTSFDVLRTLMPYLRVKRAQAMVMLAFEAEGQVHKHSGPKGHPKELWKIREKFYNKLRRMK